MSLKQKIFLCIVIVAFIFSLIPTSRRWKAERENLDVCITMDGHALIQLAAFAGKSPQSIAEELGLNSVTVQPLTVRMLVDRGGLYITPLAMKNKLGGAAFDAASYLKKKAVFYHVWIANPFVDNFFTANFPTGFRFLPIGSEPGRYLVSYAGRADFSKFFLPDFLAAPLGFYPMDLNAFQGAGVEIILRPMVGQNSGTESLPEILAEGGETRQIIFAGGKVWGHPANIKETADIFIQRNLVWGFVEPFLALQSGAKELGQLLADRTARVHSIQQGEVNILSADGVIARYLRAVRERNARILYIRPILNGDSAAAMLANNKVFIDGLRKALQEEGYKIGDPGLYPPLSLGIGELGFLYCGLLVAFSLCLSFYKDLPNIFYGIIIGGGLLLAGLLLILTKMNLLLQGSMLMAALIGPLLPLLLVLQKGKASRRDWFATSFGTILGAMYLSAFAVDRLGLLGIESFRGVKFTLLVPLFFLAVYLFKEKRPSIPSLSEPGWPNFKSLLKFPVVATVTLLGLALIFYIMRSGNFPLFPVPTWEVNLRNFLERVFVIRPRFKEIFWGHPLLVLGLHMHRRKEYPWISILFILLGCMGQITIVNSFVHFHTPLWVSLWRTVMGLLIGGLLGGLAICLGKAVGLLKGREG